MRHGVGSNQKTVCVPLHDKVGRLNDGNCLRGRGITKNGSKPVYMNYSHTGENPKWV